ncbi:hypothetical protein PanWU01x14_344250 [Parasponia andersonii]|uniref:Uncharacterized protein n=1 Tax=Parasponia andersonii TaxID=3476 RepID=A0A2P5AD49_PARAD|nr:hypothetical protein PanWU01x14_344250 [Parasponia andersonii]
MTVEEGPYSPGVDDAQRDDPAPKPELEALTPENVELVTTRTLAQDLTEELSSRFALAKHSEAALTELRSDFDVYRGLEEARFSSAVAHAMSIERARSEELAARLAQAEADRLAQSEATRLAQAS